MDVIEAIKKCVIEDNASIDELIKKFGDQVENHWVIRRARADALAGVSLEDIDPVDAANSSVFKDVSKQGNIALHAGFFRPTQIVLPERPTVKPIFTKAGKEILILSDLHAPDHDPHALDVVLQVGQSLHLDRVVIAGDAFDVQSLSKYTPSAERPYRWVEERKEALVPLIEIRGTFKDLPIDFIFGNHDIRPEKFIASKVPQLQGLFDLPTILGTTDLGFNYPESNRVLLADGNLLVKHGTTARANAGYSVHAELRKTHMSTIIGHTHRRSVVEVTRTSQSIRGEMPMVGVELGCLQRLNPEYVPQEDTADWQQGAAVVTVFDRGMFNVEPIRIHKGRAMFRGKIFSSRIKETE